jgi:hypothetical protein
MNFFEAALTLGPGLLAFLGLLGLSPKARIVLRSTLAHPTRADVIVPTENGYKIVPRSEIGQENAVRIA